MNSQVISIANLGRVMVLGSRGMVGSACIRELQAHPGVSEIIPVCRDRIDLTDQRATIQYIASERPDWVIIAAAKVGGIHANKTYPADFIYQNLSIQNNAIDGSYRAGVEKLIFLGSSCIYPKYCPRPIKEEYLLSGSLEPTNEPYSLAKIAGIKMCESYNQQFGTDYRSLMPTNLYGPGDNYHAENSHVIPGLIRRFHEAKVNDADFVSVWGTGEARREFLYIDDLATAISVVMETPKHELSQCVTSNCSHLNVGSGYDISIADLAKSIKTVISFEGRIEFNESMPDGTPQKLMDSSRIQHLGWSPEVSLKHGLTQAYHKFLSIGNQPPLIN